MDSINSINLYDIIKSPLSDDETIRKLIGIYADNEPRNTNEMYSELIRYGKENRVFSDNRRAFIEEVEIPSFSTAYDFIKQHDDFIEVYDRNYKLCKEAGCDGDYLYYHFPLYPIERYRSMIDHFNSYEDLFQYYVSNGYMNYRDNLFDYNQNHSPKIKQRLIDKGFSERDIDKGAFLTSFIIGMKISFQGGFGIMGFHVNKANLGLCMNGKKWDKDDLKYYINAGTDTYKFARLFQEECEKKGLNYYYKVANGDSHEYTRCDKMCIYTPYKDAINYLEIIKKVIEEHPEFKYEKPPLTTGVIDEYIGVGQDPKKGSYNQIMGEILINVFNKQFQGIERKDIKEYVESHSGIIDAIRTELIEEAKKYGRNEKVFADASEVSQIKRIEVPEDMIKEVPEHLRMRKLVESINPVLTNRRVKLPNGIEISGKQYIEEVVYPKLPKEDFVTLDNGIKIPLQQFVEEEIMYECQEKYNGDVSRYMAEKTQNNGEENRVTSRLEELNRIISETTEMANAINDTYSNKKEVN